MIKNRVRKIWKDHSGTALLTAMLVMGVLLAISITLSTLVIREVKITKDLMDAGKAYYSAESGIEEALFYLNNELPGWSEPGEALFASGSRFSYSIKNTCQSYPCFDVKEYNVDQVPKDKEGLKTFYATLDLNQNVLIPLFVVKKEVVDGVEQKSVKSVKNFTVEFYGDFDPSRDLKIDNLSGWDVLRWKVFGMKKDDSGGYGTDAISDFSPLAQSTVGGIPSDAQQPSWFGTRSCNVEKDPQEVKDSRITNDIICNTYVTASASIGYDKCDVSLLARDYYGDDENGDFGNRGCYSILDFLTLHQTDKATGLNYLSLTNMMNPAMLKDDVFKSEEQRAAASKIHFRVETYDDETVREIAEIVSDGYSGDSKQSIKVMKRKDTYMPVFNFSIYSTFGSDEYYCNNATEEMKNGEWYKNTCQLNS